MLNQTFAGKGHCVSITLASRNWNERDYVLGQKAARYPVPACIKRRWMGDGWMYRHPDGNGSFDVVILKDDGTEIMSWWSMDGWCGDPQ